MSHGARKTHERAGFYSSLDYASFRSKQDIDRVRRENGMVKLEEKQRNCLRCDKQFLGVGNFNRLCDDCRRQSHGL